MASLLETITTISLYLGSAFGIVVSIYLNIVAYRKRNIGNKKNISNVESHKHANFIITGPYVYRSKEACIEESFIARKKITTKRNAGIKRNSSVKETHNEIKSTYTGHYANCGV